jgi:nucleotide-binding universal stress UspA family protein
MFKTILVPTDGSDLSMKAIEAAIEFAKSGGGKLIGLSVAEPYPFTPLAEGAMAADPGIYEESMMAMAQQNVQKISDAAAQAGVPCEAVATQSFSPSEEIINTAQKYSCDVIFMSSHGRKGLSKLFVASETQKVLAHSTIPVLVFR